MSSTSVVPGFCTRGGIYRTQYSWIITTLNPCLKGNTKNAINVALCEMTSPLEMT